MSLDFTPESSGPSTPNASHNTDALEELVARQLDLLAEVRDAVVTTRNALEHVNAHLRLSIPFYNTRLAVRLRADRLAARRSNFFRPRLGAMQHYGPRMLVVPDRYLASRPPESPPVISIVTPSYNQGEYVEETIRSVIDQGYPNLEYIVQDGGSKDSTTDVLERVAPELFHVESRRDSGQANAINIGFGRASGEIMAYLNSDDMLLPGALNYVASFFAENPDVDVVYGHRVVVDSDTLEVGRWVMPRHDDEVLSWADYVPQETLFWRRKIWDASGGMIDESFKFAIDWDLLLRFRDANARMVRLPRFLGAFRVHAAQKTTAEMQAQGVDEMRRLRRRVHGRNVSFLDISKNIRPYLKRHVMLQKLYRLHLLRY